MAFIYKNPTANVSLSAPEGVSRTTSVGTNFSVSQIGGYQEVFYLENLQLQFSGTGLQQLSANTIPINITVGNNAGLSWTTLSLNSDNIFSGRRKLGMLVYVYETDTTYQYSIDNYDTLYGELTGLTGNSGLTIGATSTVVNARSQAGRDFINTWTGSTIEGQSGVTRENALWKIYYGPQVLITGGTYDSGTTTLNLVNTTGGTISITGFTSEGGTTVTGGTYDHTTGELTLNNSDDTSVTISGIIDVYTTGGTLNAGNLELFDSTGGTQTISGFTLLEYVKYDETLNLDTGSRLIDAQPLSGYSMVQYNYVLGDGSNYRSGTFTITSDRNNISYSEICTQSVGYTKDVVLSAITNSGNIEFRGAFPSDDWQINFVRTTVPVINLGPVPSLTPTPTPTNSPQPITPSVTPTSTVTPSVTPTITPTQSVTPSISVTPTITPTASITPSVTPTITPTPSITPTQTPGYLQYELGATTSWPPGGPYTVTWTDPYGNPASYSFSGSNEVGGYTFCAIVGSVSVPIQIEIVTTAPCTVLPTPTPSVTPSVTPTIAVTSTPTVTPTPSITPTITPTPSVTPTTDVTPTPSVTPSVTPTITPTVTVTPSSPTPTSGFTATIFESGSDVIWSGSGSFNLTDLTYQSTNSISAGYNSASAIWVAGPASSVQGDYYDGITTYETTFGSGGVAANSGSGSIFGILPGTDRVLVVPTGYTSSTFISGSTTYSNQTISSMGLTPGTYVWSWGTGPNADSLTLVIEGTPTPSVTPTVTPTETLTPTPSVTPTTDVTPTPSVTPTETLTPTPSVTPTTNVTPTPSVTPTITPTESLTPTPSVTPTTSVTPTITPTESLTPTPSVTPTITPTVTTSPIPVTGYSFNLIDLPYNFPSSGNTIINNTTGIQTGSTNPNVFDIANRGIFWNSIDSDDIDRTNYFSQFTGQSVTITMSQTGSTAIYSGDTDSLKSWSANTGTPPGVPGTGFVFGTSISVPGNTATTGNAIVIQSASTEWNYGIPVYISVELNTPVTPTPTPSVTPTITPTVTTSQVPVTPTVTPTETLTPTPSVTPTITPTVTPTNVNTFQIFNNTTTRTVTDALINSVSVPLTSGSYPINSGQQGFALTHNSISTNELQYTFGGSGLFDIVAYKNGVIELSLTSYNNSLVTIGSLNATPTDIIVLIISDSE